MLAAVISAIDQVESVEGLEVLHVDPDELVWASEIAQRVSLTRQSVDQLIKGQRTQAASPPPWPTPPANPLWRWSEVDAWFAAYEGREPATERLLVLGAIKGALQARHTSEAAVTPPGCVRPSSTSWRRSSSTSWRRRRKPAKTT